MTPLFLWRDLRPDYGVLEVDEGRRPPPGAGLELHVLLVPLSPGTLAWWELDDGRLVRLAEVGLA
ncbi:MAG TPA: hypothetical protein VFS43_13895 [Polyangiaceae bacterium]|nr:hypothetical protein [Polyangiaceae bacterium]